MTSKPTGITEREVGYYYADYVIGLEAALAAEKAKVARLERIERAVRAYWAVAYHDVGWHEGETPEWSCIRTEDANRIEPLADALEDVLAETAETADTAEAADFRDQSIDAGVVRPMTQRRAADRHTCTCPEHSDHAGCHDGCAHALTTEAERLGLLLLSDDGPKALAELFDKMQDRTGEQWLWTVYRFPHSESIDGMTLTNFGFASDIIAALTAKLRERA